MIKIFLFLAVSILGFANHAVSQGFEGISGKIVDEKNRPLPYATIILKNISIGVISNQNGDFRLPLKLHLTHDTLKVSYIGYVTKQLPIGQLKSDGSNVIVLKESSTHMAELEIQGKRRGRLTGKRIVAAAISNININYPMHRFSYVAYYRDYQIKDSTYTNLNEAIVRVVDNGFNTNDQIETDIHLMEYRVNKAFPIDSASSIPYDNIEKKFIPNARLGAFGGNELAILRVHDALRNYQNKAYSFVDIFSKNFIRNHLFRISRIIDHNNIQLYEIKFASTQMAGAGTHFSSGKIYIEKQNYKIHKMEYSMYEKSEGGKLIYNIKVEYNDKDGKMYLNYISFNNEFQMRNPDDFRVLETWIRSDFGAFFVLFSHEPDSLTVMNKNNYNFTIRGKRVALDTIRFSGKGKDVVAVIRNPGEYGLLADKNLAKEMTAEYINIRDHQNRIVNQMTFIQATQYREIFVQRVEPDAESSTDVAGMDKFTPLNKAELTTDMRDFSDYWMNTPLKKEID